MRRRVALKGLSKRWRSKATGKTHEIRAGAIEWLFNRIDTKTLQLNMWCGVQFKIPIALDATGTKVKRLPAKWVPSENEITCKTCSLLRDKK